MLAAATRAGPGIRDLQADHVDQLRLGKGVSMGSIFRRRTGLVAVLAIVVGGVFAPSALATTPLTITKTAAGHWTRSYDWTIDKQVSKSVIELEKGQSSTANYTVTLTKSAGSEKIWVDGQVCVTNNGLVATEGLAIEDRIQAVLADGETEPVILGMLDVSGNPVLDPGESHCYSYSFPVVPNPNAVSYRNVARATITNDDREPGTPLGPTVREPFTLPAAPVVTNDTVTVDDTNGMSWSFSASGSRSYTRTFTCDRDKGTHENTATIRETGQSDSATVVVKCKEKNRDDNCKKGKKDKDRWGWGRHDDRRGDDCDDDDHGHHYDGHDRGDCNRNGNGNGNWFGRR